MEVSDGNKIIMDFLGKEYAHWTFESRTSWINARKNLNSYVFRSVNDYKDLRYRISWDWLMPVISKCIEKEIWSSDYTNQLHDGLLEQNIEQCWLACVNFIYELK